MSKKVDDMLKTKKTPIKIITFSYDDGRIEDVRLVELLNKYGLKASFHLNSGLVDKKNFVKKADVKTLYEGHEVSAHTVSHPRLLRRSRTFIRDEIEKDVLKLSEACGYQVRGMSYPYGHTNRKIRKIAEDLGIEYGRSVINNKNFDFPKNVLNWRPSCHDKKGMAVAQRFFNDQDAKLLYIWGHSYEFTDNNRWEEFEKLCEYVSNRSDIWYATNIEIIDYLNN